MNKSVLFSSQSVHWATPKAVYDALNEEFQFDYDPCPLGGNGIDGTSVSWVGRRVFCNPPYNRGIGPFLEKASEAEIAVFLLPARTDTKWFHGRKAFLIELNPEYVKLIHKRCDVNLGLAMA